MATQTVKVCDVFGRKNDVETFRVYVEGVNQDGTVYHVFASDETDLCPSALKRLQRFVERGLTPPKGRHEAPMDPSDESLPELLPDEQE